MLVGHQENGGGERGGYATRARVGVPLLFVRAGRTATSADGDAASSRQDIKRRGACDDAGRNNSDDNGKNEYRVSVAVMTATFWVGSNFKKDKHSRNVTLCSYPTCNTDTSLHHASKRAFPHWEVIKAEKVTT